MPSTFSPLKIQLMATGENNTTWGDVSNINLGTALEEAIVGSADVTFASADVTLTLTDTNTSQTARNMRLRCTGTTGGSTRNLIVPSIEKPYIVKNDCADSIVVKTTAGTGITVPTGKTMWVYSDATNVVDAVTHLSSLTLGTDLAVSDGGTGASTFTANGVIYGNTTSALLATAAGTTGQVLVGNTGAAPSWATLTGIGVTSFSAGTTGFTPSTATTGAITLAGTLGVANGGTGATTLTSGYLVKGNGTSAVSASVVYDTGTDVGIGTTTPVSKLHVNAASGVTYATVGNGNGGTQLGVDAAGLSVLSAYNANVLRFGNSSNATFVETMRISAAGNVGIGTSSPADKLVVSNGGAAGLEFDPASGFITAYNRSTSAWTKLTTRASSYTFNLQGATDALNIDSAGNVGIGTTTPSLKFVVSNAGAAGLEIDPTAVASAPVIQSYNRSGAAYTQLTYNALLHVWQTSGTERMRIDSSGNVGIGTSSPLTTLHVQSSTSSTMTRVTSELTGSLYYSGYEVTRSGTAGGALMRSFRSAALGGVGWEWLTTVDNAAELAGTYTSRMVLNNDGNVGIGTTLPSYTLDVRTNGSNAIRVGSNGNAFGTLLSWDNPTGEARLSSIGAYVLTFGTNSTERMRIDSSGNVGIGTANPAQKLAVSNGGANGFELDPSTGILQTYNRSTSAYSGLLIYAADQRFFTGTSPAERARITSAGQMLVGTTTANGIFSVVGDQISVGNAAGSGALGIQIKGTSLSAIPAAQVQAYIATGDSAMGVAGDLLIAPRTDVVANIRFITGTTPTERMRITSTGPVLIGLTAAYQSAANATNLQIGDPLTTSGAGISLGATTTSDIAFADNTTGTGQYAGLIRYLHSSNSMSFWTDSTVRMSINNVGNVGIGTTSPSLPLDVIGQARLGGSTGYVFGVGTAFVVGQAEAYTTSTTPLGIGTTGAASMQLYTASTERMRIDTSGNVGIGTSAPGEKLQVVGSIRVNTTGTIFSNIYTSPGNVQTWFVNNGSSSDTYLTSDTAQRYRMLTGVGHRWETAVSGTAGAAISWVERMALDLNGNLGIGTGSPGYKLDVATAVTNALRISGPANVLSDITDGTITLRQQIGTEATFGTVGAHSLVFRTNNTERARIDTSGNLLVGTTSTSVYNSASATGHVLEANGTVQHSRSGFAALLLNRTTSDGSIVEFFRDGSVVGTIGVTTTATAYNTSSDYRLKDIDGPITNSGAYIDALKPVQGSWKADGSRFIGLLAHEVQEVSETPIATGEKDGEEMQAMDYSAPELIANLIAEIQSLRARVAQLEGN